MKKIESLRAWLLKSVPALGRSPESLSIYVDRGHVTARATGSLSFEYSYTVSLWLQRYAGDFDAVVVPLIDWIAENEPNLLERDQKRPFTFESDILDAALADVEITIDLSERVMVERTPAGLKVRHLPESPRGDAFPGVDNVRLAQNIADDGDMGPVAIVP